VLLFLQRAAKEIVAKLKGDGDKGKVVAKAELRAEHVKAETKKQDQDKKENTLAKQGEEA